MKKQIPNIITAFRLLMVPVFVVAFFTVKYAGTQIYDTRVAFAVFLAASASDLLDGYLARKWEAISEFGKLFDPLADKLMQVAAMACLAIAGYIPLVAVVIIAVKELTMLIGGIIISKKRGFAVYSNWFGKAASFIFNITVCLCFFRNIWFTQPTASLILDIIVYISVALSVIAMIQYAVITMIIIPRKQKSESKGAEEEE